VNLEEAFRRIHPNSANLFHRRSPFGEICNELTLAHAMPSGAVHPITPINSETPRRPNPTSKRALTCRTAELRFHLQANGSDKGLDRLMIEGSMYHQLPSELLRIA
jgi:hypothetical protein